MPEDPCSLDFFICTVDGTDIRIGGIRPVSDIPSAQQGIYTCPYCNRMFVYKMQFDGHMNTHLGRRPFICKHCGKGFTYQSNLSRHKHYCQEKS